MNNGPKWLWPAAIGTAVVALIAIALVREPIRLDPTTPEGTVQEYLQALSDRNFDAAFELLDPESFEGCNSSDIQNHFWEDTFTASLVTDDDADHGERAFVDVSMRFGTGGVLGGGWESNETFVLIANDGLWWITEDPWPYFGWDCRDGGF